MREKLKKGIAVLGAAYDFFTEEKSITYYANLQDLQEEAVIAAIGQLIRTEDKCPSIAKIRKKTKALIDAAQGKRELGAGRRGRNSTTPAFTPIISAELECTSRKPNLKERQPCLPQKKFASQATRTSSGRGGPSWQSMNAREGRPHKKRRMRR